jgi:hypothetical protein
MYSGNDQKQVSFQYQLWPSEFSNKEAYTNTHAKLTSIP